MVKMLVIIRTEFDDFYDDHFDAHVDIETYEMTTKEYQEELEYHHDLFDRGIINLKVHEVTENVKLIEVYY